MGYFVGLDVGGFLGIFVGLGVMGYFVGLDVGGFVGCVKMFRSGDKKGDLALIKYTLLMCYICITNNTHRLCWP